MPILAIALRFIDTIDDAEVLHKIKTARSAWVAQAQNFFIVAWPSENRTGNDPPKMACIHEETITADGRKIESIKTGPGFNQSIRIVLIKGWLLGGMGLKLIDTLETPEGTFAKFSFTLVPVAVAIGCVPLLITLYPRYRALLRRRKSQCVECGYCLFGNTSGICPECGKTTKVNATNQRAIAT